MTPPLAPPATGDMRHLRDLFLASSLERHCAPRSVSARGVEITRFVLWCETRGVLNAREVSRPVLERYRSHLFYYRKAVKTGTPEGTPLSIKTQCQRLLHLREWFRWLTLKDHLPANPAADLELPRLPANLPKSVLTQQEAERVLGIPDLTTPLGLRDRAIIEVLCATGMRRMEVARLGMYDLDAGRGIVHIREGKGKKDRILPITKRAVQWVDRYLVEARPLLASGSLAPMPRRKIGKRMVTTNGYAKERKYGSELPPGARPEDVLFLTRFGEPFDMGSMGNAVAVHLKAAGIQGKQVSCHTLRHSVATGMLDNGADIRFVQAMLGHANLQTTQIYTHVSVEKLRQVVEATHLLRKDESGASGEAQLAPASCGP